MAPKPRKKRPGHRPRARVPTPRPRQGPRAGQPFSLRRLTLLTTAALAIAVATWLLLGQARSGAERVLTEALGRRVSVEGDLSLRPTLPPTIVLRRVRVHAPQGASGAGPLRIGLLEARVRIASLLSSRPHLEEVRARDVEVLLALDAEGRANWESDPSLERAPPPVIDRVIAGPVRIALRAEPWGSIDLAALEELTLDTDAGEWSLSGTCCGSESRDKLRAQGKAAMEPSGSLRLTVAGRVGPRPLSATLDWTPPARTRGSAPRTPLLDRPLTVALPRGAEAELQAQIALSAGMQMGTAAGTISASLKQGALRVEARGVELVGARSSGELVVQGDEAKGRLEVHGLELERLGLASAQLRDARLARLDLNIESGGATLRELLQSPAIRLSARDTELTWNALARAGLERIRLPEARLRLDPAAGLRAEASGHIDALPLRLRLEAAPPADGSGPMRPWPARAELSLADARISAEGTLAAPGQGSPLSLRFSLRGERGQLLRALLGSPASTRLAPYSVEGRLRRDGRGYRFSDLHVHLPQGELDGELLLDGSGARPSLSGELRSPRIEAVRVARTASSNPPAAASAGRASPHRLPPLLEALDLAVDLALEELRLHQVSLQNARIELRADRGELGIPVIRGRIDGAPLEGRVRIDRRAKNPRLELALHIDDLDYQWWIDRLRAIEIDLSHLEFGWMLDRLEPGRMVQGPTSLSLELTGPWVGWPLSLQQTRGQAELVGGQGKVFTRLLRTWASDYLQLINPATWLGKDESEILCTIARLEIEQGMARTRALRLELPVATVTGTAQISLAGGQVEGVLVPEPRKTLTGTPAKPLQITGDLRRLRVSSEREEVEQTARRLAPGTTDPIAAVALLGGAGSCPPRVTEDAPRATSGQAAP